MVNIDLCLDEIQLELSDRLIGNIDVVKIVYLGEFLNRFEWQFRYIVVVVLINYCWLGEEWEILIGLVKY